MTTIKVLAVAFTLMFYSSSATAEDQYQFRGKVSGPDGTMRGQIIISSKSLDVQKKFLWIQDSISYDFKGTKSVRIRRGLLRTKIRVREEGEGRFIQVRTWAWHYEAVRELLRDKL